MVPGLRQPPQPNTCKQDTMLCALRDEVTAHQTAMKGPSITVCLLLAGLSQAVRVYLNPVTTLPSRVTASWANAVLSRHLGLEAAFEQPFDGQSYNELSSQESFVGQGRIDALLLTVDENLVKGVCLPNVLRE